MQEIIQQNKEYTLTLEFMGKQHGGYWLELINRATGHVKIMTALNKGVFEGITIRHALKWLDDVEYKPMYKAGVK